MFVVFSKVHTLNILLGNLTHMYGGTSTSHYGFSCLNVFFSFRMSVSLFFFQDFEEEIKAGRWFHVSDTYVAEVNIERVLKAQAYLLFYERLV